MNEVSGSIIWKRGDTVKGSVAYSGGNLESVIDSFINNRPNDVLCIDWSEFDEKTDKIVFDENGDGERGLFVRREDL